MTEARATRVNWAMLTITSVIVGSTGARRVRLYAGFHSEV